MPLGLPLRFDKIMCNEIILKDSLSEHMPIEEHVKSVLENQANVSIRLNGDNINVYMFSAKPITTTSARWVTRNNPFNSSSANMITQMTITSSDYFTQSISLTDASLLGVLTYPDSIHLELTTNDNVVIKSNTLHLLDNAGVIEEDLTYVESSEWQTIIFNDPITGETVSQSVSVGTDSNLFPNIFNIPPGSTSWHSWNSAQDGTGTTYQTLATQTYQMDRICGGGVSNLYAIFQ